MVWQPSWGAPYGFRTPKRPRDDDESPTPSSLTRDHPICMDVRIFASNWSEADDAEEDQHPRARAAPDTPTSPRTCTSREHREHRGATPAVPNAKTPTARSCPRVADDTEHGDDQVATPTTWSHRHQVPLPRLGFRQTVSSSEITCDAATSAGHLAPDHPVRHGVTAAATDYPLTPSRSPDGN